MPRTTKKLLSLSDKLKGGGHRNFKKFSVLKTGLLLAIMYN